MRLCHWLLVPALPHSLAGWLLRLLCVLHLCCVQDGVPDCLQQLGRAGINVWVLTGDKVETAISIAFSCKLFTDDMGVVEFRESDCQNAVSVEDRRRVSAPLSAALLSLHLSHSLYLSSPPLCK